MEDQLIQELSFYHIYKPTNTEKNCFQNGPRVAEDGYS